MSVEADGLDQIPPELEVQAAVEPPVWVPGTELWSSGRAASALDPRVISSPPRKKSLYGTGCYDTDTVEGVQELVQPTH